MRKLLTVALLAFIFTGCIISQSRQYKSLTETDLHHVGEWYSAEVLLVEEPEPMVAASAFTGDTVSVLRLALASPLTLTVRGDGDEEVEVHEFSALDCIRSPTDKESFSDVPVAVPLMLYFKVLGGTVDFSEDSDSDYGTTKALFSACEKFSD